MTDAHVPDPLIETLRAWPDALAAADAMFFKGEADPRTRGTGHFVYVLDTTPEWERFVRVWERASRILPPLYKRVVHDVRPGRLPMWQDDPNFDLSFHVRRLGVPAPGTLREVFDYAQADGMEPHDPGRPLWQVTLMEGLDGGRAALLLKFHHSWMDGNATIQMAHLVHDTTRDGDLDKPMPKRPAVSRFQRSSPVETLARAPFQTVRDVQRAADVAGRLAKRVLTRPGEVLGQTAELLASTRRMMTPVAAEPSPLLRLRSAGSHFEVLDVPFADLRRAAKAVDCSINDAYLAGVIGGVRRYHEHFDVLVDALPMGMPISTRSSNDPAFGNQVSATMIAAPVGVTDAVERMKRFHEIVLAARHEPAMDVLSGMAGILVHLPDRLMTGPLARLMKIDLGVTQVRGIQEPNYLAGAQILRTYGFGPKTGLAAFVSMLSHLDTCCIAIHTDPAAVTAPDVFVRCLAEGFEEVVAVGRPPRRGRSTSQART